MPSEQSPTMNADDTTQNTDETPTPRRHILSLPSSLSNTASSRAAALPGLYLDINRYDQEWEDVKGIYIPRKPTTKLPHEDNQIDDFNKYAFSLVRYFKPSGIASLHNVKTEVQVWSPYFSKAAEEVMGCVANISWKSKPLKFEPDLLLSFLDDFETHLYKLENQSRRTAEESLTIEHLDFFIRFMRMEYQSRLAELYSLIHQGIITFGLLWGIYRPGNILFTLDHITGRPRCVRLVGTTYKEDFEDGDHWMLECAGVERTDEQTGLSQIDIKIPTFPSVMPIDHLKAFPLERHSQKDLLRETLIRRGRKWYELRGFHHKRYDAIAYRAESGDPITYKKTNIKSRIIIDRAMFLVHDPVLTPPGIYRTLAGKTLNVNLHIGPIATKPPEDMPTDDDLLLASTVVYGLSLSGKEWLVFDVEYIEDIEWNDEAFKNLALPPEQKELIESLVESHSQHASSVDDFVEGKGRGLIFSLFGPPGVGKTLTAEATSEHTRRPLYIVGAGEIGTDASGLETNLRKIFSITSIWSAVVLIDEADVFLEKRSTSDLDRNAIVAVLLRQLEYFPGILFLTTNRVIVFDEALQSRIHVSIHYPDLTADAKEQIWRAFLARAGISLPFSTAGSALDGIPGDWPSDSMSRLRDLPINGRQIKNTVNTAVVLARHKKEKLNSDHIFQVLRMNEEYSKTPSPSTSMTMPDSPTEAHTNTNGGPPEFSLPSISTPPPLPEPSTDSQPPTARRQIILDSSGSNSLNSRTTVPGLYLDVNRFDQEWEEARGRYIPRRLYDEPGEQIIDDYNRYAFSIVRFFTPSRTVISLHDVRTEIQIWSPHFVQAAELVMKNVQSISWQSKPLRFTPELLLCFLNDFQEYLDGLEQKPMRDHSEALIIEHVDFFIRFMKMEYQQKLRDLRDLLKQGQITFDLLWGIYRPGAILFTRCGITNLPLAVRLVSSSLVEDTGKQWKLLCEYVDVDDERFGLCAWDISIPYFAAVTKIDHLPAFPITRHSQSSELQQTLLERGKKWLSLRGVHHQRYDAIAFRAELPPIGVPDATIKFKKVNTKSRIMIDRTMFGLYEGVIRPPSLYRNLKGESLKVALPGDRENPLKSSGEELLNDDLLLLAPAYVYGFSLGNKMWLMFSIDSIQDIEWNDSAFKNLSLPAEQKELIESLVETHSQTHQMVDDFVEGKGRGLIFSLFGPPGVGKTLTAEATSEHTRRPLYMVGANEIGTISFDLEKNLSRIFAISAGWNAIVLVDEADVFLQKRSSANLERNSIVAVLLRKLEYFPGILFLTTNRAIVFDEALQSRIHVSIHYKDLSPDAKESIWVSFLGRAGVDLSDEKSTWRLQTLQKLRELPMNGRQIKNAVNTACVLAKHRKQELLEEHVFQVIEINDQFNDNANLLQKPPLEPKLAHLSFLTTVFSIFPWLAVLLFGMYMHQILALVLIFATPPQKPYYAH